VNAQRDLFGSVRQRPRHKEAPAVYGAVRWLRGASFRVLRVGKDHLVGGRRCNYRQMMTLAESVGWRGNR
jgi:hypothetical protein